jgi:predicted metal-binding membrane protein
LFGSAILCGDLLLHEAVRAETQLEDNTWLLTALPLLAAGLYQFTGFKTVMLDAWRGEGTGTQEVEGQPFRRFVTSGFGFGGLGAFAPLLIVIFAIGESSLALTGVLGAAIVAEAKLPRVRWLRLSIGATLLIAATSAVLTGAEIVCAHDGSSC